ncbi:Cu+-exporting ATPase [Rhizobium sp. RU20A]|uniref:heavy metal translocating P-type ATPase n=1 Tax=Rhizobium sp. RU20A TaxID=1907412 RepID=UPI000955D1ED|nr:heavy metal translocating P-type ATPase [Rhizobium sp. RU20A]SIQ34243.1 Cu+-exporting ATPase [Rhizobium sp. RU20A]
MDAHNAHRPQTGPTGTPGPTLATDIPVEGMHCASCAGRVEKAIRAVPGVADAAVNIATHRATVRFEEASALPLAMPAVITAIQSTGFKPVLEERRFAVTGLHCASCVGRTEKALLAVPGVAAASVNLAAGTASVSTTPATPQSALDAAVTAAGFGTLALESTAGKPAPDLDALRRAETAALGRDVALAALLTLPLFIVEMGGHLFPTFHHALAGLVGNTPLRIGEFVLATLVLALPGRGILMLGLKSLLRRAPEMNALVLLGAGSAWLYSTIATFLPGLLPEGRADIYFEAAAVIVTLILAGRYLEARARGRAGDAIRKLAGLAPKTARLRRDGAEIDVGIETVRPGDIVLIRPGERIPVDGTVIEGRSHVDEAMVTGEPMPTEKTPESPVLAGTVNGTGSFAFEATKVGADTLLAQIVRLVETAQGAKLPIQALVDRITARFVPAVMMAALVTLVAWLVLDPAAGLGGALVNAVAVLIIACPCAMGLATPTSIMVATGRAAELGILFRKGDALQRLRDVDVIAFDKTGTLTEGRPELTDLWTVPGYDRASVLALAASLESASEHPVGAAIVAAAKAEGLALSPASNVTTEPGAGITGTVEGHQLRVGTARGLEAHGIDLSSVALQAEGLAGAGRAPLFIALDGQLAAIGAVADRIKPTTPAALAALRHAGVRLAMITGDNPQTAARIAADLQIEHVVAGVLPGGKVDALKELRAKLGGDGRPSNGRGGRIAFVGDGINDAPALAAADVGIALGTGTDIAIESADVVLMAGDLTAVVRALKLSRATIRNIWENLFWAFAYNVGLIPVAAGALYPVTGTLLSPMLAAGAMALSSAFVVGNALRLRSFGTGNDEMGA